MGNPERLADGEGFEPPVGVNPRRFSRPVQSTTLPPILASISKQLAERDLERKVKLVRDLVRRATTPPAFFERVKLLPLDKQKIVVPEVSPGMYATRNMPSFCGMAFSPLHESYRVRRS